MKYLPRVSIFLIFLFLYACQPPAIKRLERLERLINNLEKEVQLTKTNPKLADIRSLVNHYNKQLEVLSSLPGKGNRDYSATSERLREIKSQIEEIGKKLASLSDPNMPSQKKLIENFSETLNDAIKFVNSFRERDESIYLGNSFYNEAQEFTEKARMALPSSRDEARAFLEKGKEAFDRGNKKFIDAKNITEKLIDMSESFLKRNDSFSKEAKDTLDIEIIPFTSFGYFKNDLKRLKIMVNKLK